MTEILFEEKTPVQIAQAITSSTPGLTNEAQLTLHDAILAGIEEALADRGLGEKPTRRVIHIEPTDAQWRTIDSIDRYNQYVSPCEDEHGVEDGSLYVFRIEGDSLVELHNVGPDGDFTYEALVDGFHGGWTKFDSNGDEISSDEDDEGDDDE